MQEAAALWREANAGQGSAQSAKRTVARELAEIAGFAPIAQFDALIPNTLLDAWRRKYKPWTVKQRWYQLRKFLRWLEQLGAPHTTIEQLEKPRKPGPRKTIATQDEIQRLLKAAGPEMRALVLMAAQLGLRWNEAMRATVAHWNRERGTLTLPVKGHREHQLPMTDDLAALFHIAAKADDLTTPALQLLAGKQISPAGMRCRWNRLKKRAALNPELRPHDLRRTAATALYDRTKDLRMVQQLLGHSDMATTAQYIAPADPDTLRPLLEELTRHPFKGKTQ